MQGCEAKVYLGSATYETDYNRVVENVRNSALMLGFLVAILGYLSEL